MPHLSKKSIEMPASPIRKLVPYAEVAKKRGIKIYHLNIGQPDIPTPPIFFEGIKKANIEILEYTHSAGTESYRKKLTEYYQKYNINVDYSDIIITVGGSEAIEIAMMTCFNTGDEIIIPEPFYANYLGFSRAADVVIKPIKSIIDNGFALPPVNEFEKLISSKTKGIMICNPSNPTGYLYTKEELEDLKKLALKYNLFLLSDEVYREFCYDGKPYHSVMHLKEADEHIVMLDSVSKRYSACGARIGALVSKNKILMAAAMKFAQARLSPPTFGQIGAEAALSLDKKYFDEVVKEYSERRNFVINELNKIPGVKCPMPGGAFYCIAELPIDDSDKFCQWLLEKFSYNNQTVMLAPATGFYSTPHTGKKEVRIAYVIKKDNLEKAIECLKMALQEYPERTI